MVIGRLAPMLRKLQALTQLWLVEAEERRRDQGFVPRAASRESRRLHARTAAIGL